MNAINKENILSKTHYGLGIYAHILRLYYPDEVVLRLVERDCGLCRNPFNANKKTLHIFIHKENILGNVYDKEHAYHEDSENAIPAGNAFDFAELHYKQQGAELLQTLNKELHLHIGEQRNFYNRPICPKSPIVDVVSVESVEENKTPQSPYSPLFSFYKAPITNTKPHKAVSLLQIYNAIKNYNEMKKTVIFCAIALMCCACGTTKYVPIETVKTEYRDKIVRDSVFCYDSIFVKEKGDTLIFERYKYLYKDKVVRDSIFVNDTIRVPYPVEVVKEVKKPLSSWQNFQVWCGRIALVVLLIVGVWKLKKKRLK